MSESTPSTWEVLKSILASFFGVQKEEVRQRDFTHGKPSQFIVIGIILTVLFVVGMYWLVELILFFALES